MENVIAIIVLVLIVGASAWYLYKAKKKGVKCVGCPSGGSCGSCSGSCSGCSCQSKK